MGWGTVTLIAFGGMLAIEGAAWAIFPAQMKRMYQDAFSMGERALHMSGIVSVAVGVLLIGFAVRSAGI